MAVDKNIICSVKFFLYEEFYECIWRTKRGGASPLSRYRAGFDRVVGINYNANMKNYSLKRGFTLAEVLITLAIIGIVAALTIPTLISKYEKKQTVTKLQKMYSILNQAYLFAKADGGDNILLNNINGNYDMDSETAHKKVAEFMENYFLPYLKISKNCKLEYDNVCFGIQHNGIGGASTEWIRKYNVILQDGSTISADIDSACDENGCKQGGAIILYVDINGTAKPNMAGKDYFMFFIMPKSGNIEFFNVYAGDSDLRTALLNDCNSTAWRRSCAALIKYDGWKISDDYDW